MKYTISFILIFGLIFTLFTACGEAPQSPTDVTATAVQQAVEENTEDLAEEVSVVSQAVEQVASKEEGEKKQQGTTKVPTTSVESQGTGSQQAKPPAQNTDTPVADINVKYPTFTGEGSLKNWLLGKNPEYFADDRGEVFSTMGNQGVVTYYRPSIPANHPLFMLSQINVHTPSGVMHYLYNGKDVLAAELVVGIANTNNGIFKSSFEDTYNEIKDVYVNSTTYSPEVVTGHYYQYKGIDFYCKYILEQQHTWIVWKQFGFAHYAVLHGRFDQIEEIIPLLYLQQVKVDNNAVIK